LKRWKVDLSGKERPPAERFDAIGGEFAYDAATFRTAVRPRSATRKKFRTTCETLRRWVKEKTEPAWERAPLPPWMASERQEEGGGVDERAAKKRKVEPERLYHSAMASAVGLLEWSARFVDGGGLECYEPQRFVRRLQYLKQGRTRTVPLLVGEAFERVRDAIDSGAVRPALADPCYGHPGDGVAGDASGWFGWGLVMGEWVYHGEWSAETRAACVRSRRRGPPLGSIEDPDGMADVDYTFGEVGQHKASISPLELVVQGFVVRAVRTHGAPANGCFYSRCDNLSAVHVVAAERARSPAMTEALRFVREEELG
jgi:hypothetical protein